MSKVKDANTTLEDQAQKAEEVAGSAAAKARATVTQASEQVSEAADSVQEKIRKTTQEAAGVISNVSDRVRSSAHQLQEELFPNSWDDVEALIKRFPTYAVLIGIGIGFLLARRN